MQKKVKTQKDDITLKKKNEGGRPAKVLKTSTPIAVQRQGQMYNNALSAKDLYRWADSADSSGAQGLKDVAEVAVQGFKAGNLARDMRILIFCLSIAGDRCGPRLPLIIIPQLRGLKGEAKEEQLRDVQLLLEVILWSTRCLLVGKWPGKRPEHACKGTPSLMMSK